MAYVESITHPTKKHPVVLYCFDNAGPQFYKFPCYLRRAAIKEAIGTVSSYLTRLENWMKERSGRKPGKPRAGRAFPGLYRDNMYQETGPYTVKIKVFVRNTWDWVEVELRKSDVDYVRRHCAARQECAPTLLKKGKEWFLSFPYREDVDLKTVPAAERTILSVDLGINNACVCSVMRSDGTVLGRHFLRLARENDCLQHKIGHIKRTQHHGAVKTRNLWAYADGVNTDIASKTAGFIAGIAAQYQVDVIVFEHLETGGKKRGSRRQRLHLWKSQAVQAMVRTKAHRLGMRVSTICAWNTSALAFDGSGRVTRDKDNYSMCTFSTGKRYHCDLSASYNIGARYFIRELLKSIPATERQRIEAKVPECARRNTCTLSTLISLNAELYALAA